GEAQAQHAVQQQARLFERPALRLAGLMGKSLQHGRAGILQRPAPQALSGTNPRRPRLAGSGRGLGSHMNLTIAKRVLGLLSIGIGVVAVASPRRMSDTLGLQADE